MNQGTIPGRAVVVSVMILLLGLAGCGPAGGAQATVDTITIWATLLEQGDIESAIALMDAPNGDVLRGLSRIVDTPWANHRQVSHAEVPAGMTRIQWERPGEGISGRYICMDVTVKDGKVRTQKKPLLCTLEGSYDVVP